MNFFKRIKDAKPATPPAAAEPPPAANRTKPAAARPAVLPPSGPPPTFSGQARQTPPKTIRSLSAPEGIREQRTASAPPQRPAAQTAPAVPTQPTMALVPTGQAAPPGQTRQRLMRVETAEANDDDIRGLRSFRGIVQTAEGTKLRTTPEHRKLCALLDNGTFVIDRNSRSHAHVLQVQIDAKHEGMRIAKHLLVDRNVVREIYEAFAKRQTAMGIPLPGTDEAAERILTHPNAEQREFLEVVAAAISLKASDFRILTTPGHECEIKFRINNRLQIYKLEDGDKWRRILRAVFNMSAENKGVYNFKTFEPAIITRANVPVLPEGVDSIRLTFDPASEERVLLVGRLHGEKSEEVGTIADIGYGSVQTTQIEALSRLPDGIILMSGPTGSGKTTTAKVILERMAVDSEGELAIMTTEDPVETKMRYGIVQLSSAGAQTAAEREKNTQDALIWLLRSDPNIIFVGEIREQINGNQAVKAAETGHLVLSTIHVQTALRCPARLRGIGIPDYNAFDHTLVRGLIGQRLLQVLCPSCKIPHDEHEASLEPGFARRLRKALGNDPALLSLLRYRNRDGCPDCGTGKGYVGRTAIAEIVRPNEAIMRRLEANDLTGAQAIWFDELHGLTLLEHAMYKAIAGGCDPKDVATVVGDLDAFDHERLKRIVTLLEAQPDDFDSESPRFEDAAD